MGAEGAHLLIVNWTVLADLRSVASTNRTELCVLKSTGWVELCFSLTDMHNLLLLGGTKLADLAHYRAVLGARVCTHRTELSVWLGPACLKLATWPTTYRTELFVRLATTWVELTHLLN